jgi:hypothetical protein
LSIKSAEQSLFPEDGVGGDGLQGHCPSKFAAVGHGRVVVGGIRSRKSRRLGR